ncbi:MAG: hypothetical protein IJJ33_20590 [Victivallales bacterium]|nr:hypothetical protein [Victivallales bacterium]
MLDLTKPFLEKGDALICFGDSITAGENSYVKYLQEALPDNRIINAGRPGDKTPWALTRFQQDVLDKKPDALHIALGANDALVGRGCWADEPMVTADAYRCNLVWMAHLAHLNGVRKVSIATPFGIEGEQFLAFGNRLQEYYLAARDAADRMGARLVPLDTLFVSLRKGAPPSERLVTKDGLHPLASRHQDIAQAILRAWHLNGAGE